MGFHALTSSKSFFTSRTQLPLFSSERKRTTTTTTSLTARTLLFNHRPSSSRIFASQEKEPPKLNSQDLMELKFGRLLGEDPKLTLAKIMGRKVNPDATFLDIEKSYYKKKGKIVEVEEVPFDVSKERKSSSKLDGLDLVRTVPVKGTTFNSDDKKVDGLDLVRPVPVKGTTFKSDDNKVALEVKRPSPPMQSKAGDVKKSSVPNVILRRPTVYKEDDVDVPSSLRMKPNLSLQMRNGQSKEKFSDMTLLRKPEPHIAKDDSTNLKPSTLSGNQKNDDELKMRKEDSSFEISNFTLLERPQKSGGEKDDEQFADAKGIVQNDGLEQYDQRHQEFHQELSDSSQLSDSISVDSGVELSVEGALQGKPKRLDQYVKKTSNFVGEETTFLNSEGYRNNEEIGNHDMTDSQESEHADWTRAEDLIKTGDKVEVEILSRSNKGFIVSFGSLVGFLPYRNLVSKWKFIAFESWLGLKGLDPSMYKQNLSSLTSYDAENKNAPPNSSSYLENDDKAEEKISPDMKLEDLSRMYEEEKTTFLSSFVGQKIRANVLSADRKLRKLIFSLRPKENNELIEKKKNLMARLQVGDIVKCSVHKITYFGVFVEVEGVSALIHQTELSWDATLNPTSYFKIGQVIEAKVLQLDFALGRIFLSLKEVTPDPLMDSLESVVGDLGNLDGRLEAAQADEEWPEVESLIKELQKIEGIQSVSKGSFFRSPGLAPTFQVYMASMFENQYKLLARSENKVQEVIVQTPLDKERMKSVIMTCANRVE